MIDRTKTTVLVIALAACLPACGRPFDVKTPARFVELEEESAYDYRATTADGVVVGIRAVEIDPDRGGNLAFWVEAVEQRMRRMGGYALLGKSDVRAGKLRGKQIRFGRDESDRPYRYNVTLFIDDDYLYVVEAGGAQEVFERAQADVTRLISTLRP